MTDLPPLPIPAPPPQIPSPPPARPRGNAFIAAITALLAILLLASFAFQLPTSRVDDWGEFAFYDPGTVFKGDALIRKGYIPTIDFGYTHGLVSLVFTRAGLAVLGSTPNAFLILTLLLEMLMAFALARIFAALQLRWPAILVFLAALPMAIMPAYLTLTHPLEAALILLALADQAEGKRPRALALLTLCLFVKPSMAYVYGFVLLVFILIHAWLRWRAMLRALLPAAITLALIFLGMTLWLGPRPVINTLIPLTGAKTYAATGFGFFAPQGRAFWQSSDWWAYVVTPAGMFLLAAIGSALGALWAIFLFLQSPRDSLVAPRIPQRPPRPEMLITIGILHTAFLLGFYGWTGSWTYYSYLPVLGLVLVFDMLPCRGFIRWPLAALLVAGFIFSHSQVAGSVAMDWKWKVRTTDGQWAYPAQLDEWQSVLRRARQPLNPSPPSSLPTSSPPHTLVMTNGYLFHLPPNVEMADAWFPEPGIPTAAEIARVQTQTKRADYVILWREYEQFDLWNSDAFAAQRKQFIPIFTGTYFTLLRRVAPALTSPDP